MIFSRCGTWPAWWLVGPNSPYGGEIDIIEGVNMQTHDDTTLHTGPGCDFTNVSRNFSGLYKLSSSIFLKSMIFLFRPLKLGRNLVVGCVCFFFTQNEVPLVINGMGRVINQIKAFSLVI